MKRIGMLLGLFLLSGCMIWAQDSTTTTTTTNNSNMAQTPDSQKDVNKNAAAQEENAADQEKQNAKNAGTKEESELDKAMARLDDAAKDLNQLISAPDNGIPDQVFGKAK